MATSAAPKTKTHAPKASGAVCGGNRILAPKISAENAPRTTQPCQVLGRPQPQPYDFAGNQYWGDALIAAIIGCACGNGQLDFMP